MQMTHEEITRQYQEAKDKNAQVKILAELNLCEKEEIIRILNESGCQIPASSKRGRKKAGKGSDAKKQEEASQQSQEDAQETPASQIPHAVRRAINDKIEYLQDMIDTCAKDMEGYQAELGVLINFLKVHG